MMEEAAKPQTHEAPTHTQEHSAAPASSSKSSKKKSFFKQRKVQIGLGVVLIVLLLVGGYFFMARKSKAPVQEEQADTADTVQTLSADQLGLSIVAKPDNKAVKIKIDKAGDIKSIEYQVTYEADSTAEEKAQGGDPTVQRGITNKADLKNGLTYESEWLDLGSCSRNVCRYDTGVKKVDLTLKIIKKNGKIYEAQKSLNLNP